MIELEVAQIPVDEVSVYRTNLLPITETDILDSSAVSVNISDAVEQLNIEDTDGEDNPRRLTISFDVKPENYPVCGAAVHAALLNLESSGLHIESGAIECFDPENPKSTTLHEQSHAKKDVELGYPLGKFLVLLDINEAGNVDAIGGIYFSGNQRSWRDEVDVCMAPLVPSDGDFDKAMNAIHLALLQTAGELEELYYTYEREEPELAIIGRALKRARGSEIISGRKRRSIVQDYVSFHGLTVEDTDEELFAGQHIPTLTISLNQEQNYLLLAVESLRQRAIMLEKADVVQQIDWKLEYLREDMFTRSQSVVV